MVAFRRRGVGEISYYVRMIYAGSHFFVKRRLRLFLRRRHCHRFQEKGRRRKAFLDFLQMDGIREPLFEFLLHRLQDIEVMDHVPPAFLRRQHWSAATPLPQSNPSSIARSMSSSRTSPQLPRNSSAASLLRRRE